MNIVRSVLGAVVVGVGLVSNASAQLAQGEKDTAFIGPVKVNESVEEVAKKRKDSNALNQLREGLRAELVTEINQTRVFQIVERERKDDIELEQAFSQVAVDPNDKNAAQMMKMKGAKFAFLPRIDAFQDSSATTTYSAIQRKDVSRTVWVSAVLSVVDTTTGALLPESPSVKVKRSNSIEYARMGAGLGGDELINQVTKELAQKLAQEVVTLMRPAKVLTVTGPQIMINRGTEAGFESGSEVEFFATEDVKDEDTGEVFKNEISVGKGVVKRADAKQSFAEAKGENLGIAKGCVVKVLKKGGGKAVVARKAPEEKLSAGSSEKPLSFN